MDATEQQGLTVIARLHDDFTEKFGLPRQSGLVAELRGRIVFEPEFRDINALRGIEEYSHLWLIWGFSAVEQQGWSPLVRPPRLGGNVRVGVFASRSPFRPNRLGLSCVRLERVELSSPNGPVLHVAGVDMLDNTPIYDIKPYLPYVDSQPQARGSFSEAGRAHWLEVEFPPRWLELIPDELRPALLGVLAHDPRPAYQDDPERVYGLDYAGFNVRFRVNGPALTVCEVQTTAQLSRKEGAR